MSIYCIKSVIMTNQFFVFSTLIISSIIFYENKTYKNNFRLNCIKLDLVLRVWGNFKHKRRLKNWINQ